MNPAVGNRYRLWLLFLSLLVAILAACQIASFWLIMELRAEVRSNAINVPTPVPSIMNIDVTARILSDEVARKLDLAERKRRETSENADAQKILTKVFLDALKQLCAPNEKYCVAGAAGPRGANGFPGYPGLPGLKGDAGSPGREGEKGSTGKHGSEGEKGEKGERGYRGLTGSRGEKGEQGIRGMPGEAGTDGQKGQEGGTEYKNLPIQCRSENYTVLSDDWRKYSNKRNFSSSCRSCGCDGGSCRCDRGTLSAGWYRFSDSIGGRINDKCDPDGWRCGAAAAGWLDGSHPSVVGSKVSRTVKFSYANECDHSGSVTAQVVNCGSYYVYSLPSLTHCNHAYCSAG